MFDEIEKFLKQAAEAAQQDQQRKANEQRRRSGGQQQRSAQRQAPPPRRLVEQAEVVEAELVDNSSLAGIDRDFKTSDDIAAHSRNLGTDVGQADQNLQAHLQQTFDHQVGTLKSARGVSDIAPERAAGNSMAASNSIFRMINSLDGIRDAIILGEVLRRPEERW